jgi:hypothetical protein
MDGFQAVKEIKSNSLAARIPIVMYTAKSGDLYVGQAQALGAVDILPKPPTRELLRAVFRRIDERDGAANEALEPGAATADAAAGEATLAGALADAAEHLGDASVTVRATDKSTAAPTEFIRAVTAEAETDRGGATRGVSWLLVAVVAGVAFFAGTQFAPRAPVAASQYDTLAWALSESLAYPYGEAPFSGTRVELVRGLVQRLSAGGFKGTLKLEGHAGQFCLLATAGGWRVADPGTPLESCDVKGFFSKQDARAASARQSPEFRTMLGSPEVAGSGVRVQIEGLGDENRRTSYPTPDASSTAGEWNTVATENNRITVSLIPD